MPSTSSVPSWSIRSGSLVPARIVATWPAASFCFTRFGRMFTWSPLPGGVSYHARVMSVPPQAAPERLTAILRRAGVLERGEVVDVTVETSRDTLISHIARLRLTYGHRGHG